MIRAAFIDLDGTLVGATNTVSERSHAAIRRARQALTPGYRPSLRSKVLKSFLEDGVNIAVRSDPDLLRAAMRG